MSVLDKVVGMDVLGLVSKLGNVVDKFVETPEEKAMAKKFKMEIYARRDEIQAEINKIEAAHRTLFVSGWRPAIGWTCVLSIFYGWIAQPILSVLFELIGKEIIMPELNTDSSITLIMSLLGMAALRTYEKTK